MVLLARQIRIQLRRSTALARGTTERWRRATGACGLDSVRLALVGAALLIAGCGEQWPSEQVGANDVRQQSGDVRQQTGEELDAAAQLAQQERIDFQRAAQEELDELKAELDALKREADSADGAAREKLQREVQLLEEKWNVAEAKLAALRAEGAQAWAAMQQQVLIALADLKESYQELRRELAQG